MIQDPPYVSPLNGTLPFSYHPHNLTYSTFVKRKMKCCIRKKQYFRNNPSHSATTTSKPHLLPSRSVPTRVYYVSSQLRPSPTLPLSDTSDSVGKLFVKEPGTYLSLLSLNTPFFLRVPNSLPLIRWLSGGEQGGPPSHRSPQTLNPKLVPNVSWLRVGAVLNRHRDTGSRGESLLPLLLSVLLFTPVYYETLRDFIVKQTYLTQNFSPQQAPTLLYSRSILEVLYFSLIFTMVLLYVIIVLK